MNAVLSSVMGVASGQTPDIEPATQDIFAGPRIQVPVVAIDSTGMCGVVEVLNPVNEGTALSKFTSYSVKGSITGITDESDPLAGVFESRKRYSDFEWLRKTLGNLFPGIRIPPLPRKQAAGRFEPEFIEGRRAGLQQFLEKCFLRSTFVNCPLMIQFLKSSGEGLEFIKAKYEQLTCKDKQDTYIATFREELATLEKPSDDSRIRNMKKFLEEHTIKLKETAAIYARMVQTEKEQCTAQDSVQQKLLELTKEESSALNAIGADQRPRQDLATILGKQRAPVQTADAFAPEKASGMEALLAAAEREVDDADAMMDAISSLGGLLVSLQDAKMQVSDGQHQMRCIEESEKGSLIGSLFGKNKYTQIQETKFRIDRYGQEAHETQDFYIAARTMFVSKEISSFFREKKAVTQWAKDEFVRRNTEQSQLVHNLWLSMASGSDPSMPAASYSGGYSTGGYSPSGGMPTPGAQTNFNDEFGF